MCSMLAVWLTLYAGISRSTANIFLRAIHLILTTTLKLIYMALNQEGLQIDKPSSLDIPIPIDIRTVYSKTKLDPDLHRIFLCPTCFMQYDTSTQVEICGYHHSP